MAVDRKRALIGPDNKSQKPSDLSRFVGGSRDRYYFLHQFLG
jgi:hypothetical protein